MPRESNIRWKSGEKEKLKAEIRRYNDRRRRAIKKNPELAGNVPTVSYKETLKNITTRNDYNRILRELNWSRAKNAFQLTKVGGANVTKWELRRAKARLRTVNRMREKERQKAKVSTEAGNMGSIEANNLLPKKMPQIKNQTAWQKFVEGLEKQSFEDYFRNKDVIYAENYLQAWDTQFGNYKINEIRNILKDLTYKDIADAIYSDATLDLNFIYGKDDIDLHDKADAIIRKWKYYVESLKY